MSRVLVIRPKAEAQAASARDWYDDQLPGLGDDFIDRLDEAIPKAHANPLHYQKVLHEIRRVLLRRFPFAVFFVAEPQRVVVLAVLHQTDNPSQWNNL